MEVGKSAKQSVAGQLPEVEVGSLQKEKKIQLGLPLEFKLSKRRWAVLLAMCIFGFTNGLTNNIASILHTMVQLLDMSIKEFVYASQAFYYLVTLMVMPTAWFVDRFGIRKSLLVCLGLATLRNTFRFLLFSPQLACWAELKLTYFVLTNIFMRLTYMIYYCLPMKLCDSWFSQEERPLAWTLMIVCPILGHTCANLAIPRLIGLGNSSVQLIGLLNLIAISFPIATILLGITKSKPKYFPSKRAQLNDSLGSSTSKAASRASSNCGQLFINIWQIFQDSNLLIQIVALVSFDKFIGTINLILQDILAASGVNQIQTGYFMACMTATSAILQICGSLFVSPLNDNKQDNNNNKESNGKLVRKCKLYLLFMCLTYLLYSLALSLRDYPQHQWWLAISGSMLFTILRFWAAPSFNELQAYLIAGSISQATVSGFTMILQALTSTLFMVGFVSLRETDNNSQDGGKVVLAGRANYFRSIVLLASLGIFVTALYLIVFDGSKRRRKINLSLEKAPLPAAKKALTLPSNLSISFGEQASCRKPTAESVIGQEGKK